MCGFFLIWTILLDYERGHCVCTVRVQYGLVVTTHGGDAQLRVVVAHGERGEHKPRTEVEYNFFLSPPGT